MAIGMAILGGLNMGMSIWAAQQKKALDMQAANEMENVMAENEIARNLTVVFKQKQFERDVASARKMGAYKKTATLLEGSTKEAKKRTKIASKGGVKLTEGTALDTMVQEAMVTQWKMSMDDHNTYTTLDNLNHAHHDWKSVSDWEHKVSQRQMKARIRLKRKGADLNYTTNMASGILGGAKDMGSGDSFFDGKGNWNWAM